MRSGNTEVVSFQTEAALNDSRELQLMRLLDQVMGHYWGVGVGVPLISGEEAERVMARMIAMHGPSGMKTISDSDDGGSEC